MIQVIDGAIKQHSLPKVGALSTGETVSGYHLLDKSILKSEGWLPLDDKEKPEYDAETQYLKAEYEILKTKVNKTYKIIEREPDELEVEIKELRHIIDILLGDTDE